MHSVVTHSGTELILSTALLLSTAPGSQQCAGDDFSFVFKKMSLKILQRFRKIHENLSLVPFVKEKEDVFMTRNTQCIVVFSVSRDERTKEKNVTFDR